jgi:hypothetical protein
MSFDNSYVLFPISEEEQPYNLEDQTEEEDDMEDEDSLIDTSSCYFLSFVKTCLRAGCLPW